ncbi:hypothetical protein [Sunxiuqinia sp. sy24]|uniref:hypothetical protein n=1 Tax=Sunxiuqinia sp. sy24 TaxID=3461495 RepID=UPI004046485D
MNELVLAGLSFGIAFVSVFLVQPSVAQVGLAKNLTAAPEKNFPKLPLLTMGGVSMFIGINLSLALCSSGKGFGSLHPLIAAMVILFFSGLLLDTNMTFRYIRQLAKLLAAAVLVLHARGTQGILIPGLHATLDALIQITFVVAFMYVFHELALYRKMTMLLLALVHALFFVLIKGFTLAAFTGMLLALALSGSLSGILIYSRYARYKKKPLPLIGHTGIFLIAIILAYLWLKLLAFWIN